MSYIGIICQHCYHFLPEEQFLSNFDNDDEKYMGCCIKCKNDMFDNKGYLRRTRDKKINSRTVYDYKCSCGYILKVKKHNMNISINAHEKTNRHKGIIKGINKIEIYCACGSYTKYGNTKRHINSRRHQKYLSSLN
jgi:hypothetical protein